MPLGMGKLLGHYHMSATRMVTASVLLIFSGLSWTWQSKLVIGKLRVGIKREGTWTQMLGVYLDIRQKREKNRQRRCWRVRMPWYFRQPREASDLRGQGQSAELARRWSWGGPVASVPSWLLGDLSYGRKREWVKRAGCYGIRTRKVKCEVSLGEPLRVGERYRMMGFLFFFF